MRERPARRVAAPNAIGAAAARDTSQGNHKEQRPHLVRTAADNLPTVAADIARVSGAASFEIL